MDNQTIYIIIAIFLIIFFVKFLTISKDNKLEHLTTQSDEAIQNLASLYNKDKLTIGSMDVTGSTTTATLKTNKLQLGDKWSFSAVGDAYANDEWLRLFKTDGSGAYYGGLAAGKLWASTDASGNPTFSGDVGGALNNLNNRINALNTSITNLQNQINQRVVIGGRYGFHRGHDNSVIWGHGIILNNCGSNNCTPG